MSYKLLLSLGISAVNLYDFNGRYVCVIQLSNGQYFTIFPDSLFPKLFTVPVRSSENEAIYNLHNSNLLGNFIAPQNGTFDPTIYIWDFTKNEKFELTLLDVLKNSTYDRPYGWGIGSPYLFNFIEPRRGTYQSTGISEDGNLIIPLHGWTNSPSIGEYSVVENQWKYVFDNTDEELERVAVRKFGIKFTFTFALSIFTGKYIKASTHGSGANDMLFDNIKATIIANATLPQLVGTSGTTIKFDRIYVHEDDSKINEGTASIYLRVFYRCYYSGEDRWCLADLNNIINAFILVSNTDSPYEALDMGSHITDIESFTSLSAVPHNCTTVFTSEASYDENWWAVGLFYGFGAAQVNKYLMMASYEGISRPMYAHYIDRETGDFLHPDLLDKHRFNHITRGIITREDYYFENSASVSYYLCNFHNQYGYDDSDTWMAIIEDYQGNECFPRGDHAIQPYGSKFVYVDTSDPSFYYDPDTNPLGFLIRELNDTDKGGTIEILDLTDEDNYYDYEDFEYLNVFDILYLAIDIKELNQNIYTAEIKSFNDINHIFVRITELNNLTAIYGYPENVYEVEDIVLVIGTRYEPLLIYNLNDLTEKTYLPNPISIESSLLVNDRYLILIGYPGTIIIVDFINGLNTSGANIKKQTISVLDMTFMSLNSPLLYYTAQHRRQLSYMDGIVFGVIDWLNYLGTGILVDTKIDCAYDINFAYSYDLRYNQLGLTGANYSNAAVETAVLSWINIYKESGESDNEARDRLITLLKSSDQFMQSGLGNDGDYLFIGLFRTEIRAMMNCSFADSLGVLHTGTEDLINQYPIVKIVDIRSVVSASDLNNKSIYFNIEIRDAAWLGRQYFGRLVLCGDYIMFYQEYLVSSDITVELSGGYWCIPIYIIHKSTLIARMPFGFIDFTEFDKLLIPCATNAVDAKTGFGDWYSNYKMKDNHAITSNGIIFSGIRNRISYVNGGGETVVPSVLRINPSTLTYEFVCGTGTYESSTTTLISYNEDKDVLWITQNELSYELTNALSATLELLT